MTQHLGMTLDPHTAAAKAVLQAAVDAFDHRTLAKALFLSLIERRRQLAPARVDSHNRHMTEFALQLAQRLAVIDRIHQRVQARDALGRQARQRHTDLVVIHTGRCQGGRDGYTAAGHVQMQLVAHPGVEVALSIALFTPVAQLRQRSQCLLGRLQQLRGNAVAWLGLGSPGAARCWTDFALGLFGRFGCFRSVERVCLSGAVLGALAVVDGGGVPGDVADEACAQVFADQGLMRIGRQADSGELGKCAAKRRFAGQGAIGLKAEQAPQRGIHGQSAAQLCGLLKAQNGLGNIGLCQCKAAALGWAGPLADVAKPAVQLQPVKGMHDALVQWREPKLQACSPLA